MRKKDEGVFRTFFFFFFKQGKRKDKKHSKVFFVWLLLSVMVMSNMINPVVLASEQASIASISQNQTVTQNQKFLFNFFKKKKAKKVKKSSQLIQKKVRQESNETLANLEYDGIQTIEINDNKPTFTKKALSLDNKAWEKYGELDDLNRATFAEAMLNQSLMPTKKRGDVSKVKPTGWKNKKIGNGYLYNRSHLIGYALSGENANWKNLMTGTAQLNSPEMLRFEMDIKTYLEKSSNNYVRYSVIPVFRGEELLARGVHLMAQSIGSDDIQLNVYIFNVQDGVTLKYHDGSSQTEAEVAEEREATKIAAEQAEAQRLADEQALAAQKKAAEEQALAEQLAAEQAQAVAEQEVVQAVEQAVYIAPQSGTKYHFSSTCRGLKQANSVVEISLTEAQNQGYTLCGWED